MLTYSAQRYAQCCCLRIALPEVQLCMREASLFASVLACSCSPHICHYCIILHRTGRHRPPHRLLPDTTIQVMICGQALRLIPASPSPPPRSPLVPHSRAGAQCTLLMLPPRTCRWQEGRQEGPQVWRRRPAVPGALAEGRARRGPGHQEPAHTRGSGGVGALRHAPVRPHTLPQPHLQHNALQWPPVLSSVYPPTSTPTAASRRITPDTPRGSYSRRRGGGRRRSVYGSTRAGVRQTQRQTHACLHSKSAPYLRS